MRCDKADALARESFGKEIPRNHLGGRRTIIEYGSEGYPEAFLRLKDPPKRLFVLGNPEALQEGLAVIGARKATPYGLACAKRFASLAAQRGVCIISGGALGCDSAAHRAALDAGGTTVVFLGGGCDRLYPQSNISLFREVVERGGALVSEQEWAFPPLRYTFRNRNRLIASLARATLIVEAGVPSGTFSTADDALEADREVLAVPGSIVSKTSAGANRLIYQGATPVIDDESFEDVLVGTFGLLRMQRLGSSSSGQREHPLLATLRANPLRMEEMLNLDEAARGCAGEPADLMVELVQLQQAGLIQRYPDGRYGPCSI